MRSINIRVWGQYACFTRPEMKIERVSYDTITPSAARGLFEAIYWKPQFAWTIEQIRVMKPTRFMTVTRNEVKCWPGFGPYQATLDKNRAQRSSQILCDVEYCITAKAVSCDGSELTVEESKKHNSMFYRRAQKGSVYRTPFLGCREFAAYFEYVKPSRIPKPTIGSRDLGVMFYDFDYTTTKPTPLFFNATMLNGVINVPTRSEILTINK